MMKLAELVGRELKWVQPHTLKREYELRAGDVTAATLIFRNAFGSFATAASADGVWTFKRVGFLQTKVTIRAAGSENDLAVFKNSTWKGGGTLELPDGRSYPANTNFWATRYDFKTGIGDSLIRYRKVGGFLHMSSAVEIDPLARSMPEMQWMVMLGWYLTLMMYSDSAAVAAAT